MIIGNKPPRCPICGYFLTTANQFAGCRCVDPGHWQAAGILNPQDYYPMAKIVSGALTEQNQRINGNNNNPGTDCC
jgi:hypothetical protein